MKLLFLMFKTVIYRNFKIYV